MKKFLIKDKRDRVLISVSNNGKFAIARYPDLDEESKKYIIDFFKESNEEGEKGVERLRKFLDYETNENEFCS